MPEMQAVKTFEHYSVVLELQDGFQMEGDVKVVDRADCALPGEPAKAPTGAADTASEKAFGKPGQAVTQGACKETKTRSVKGHLQKAFKVVKGTSGLK
ncbi:hypothetical protein DXG01_008415, partial [Tephrocybe rancida]